ncbi:MAG UNVERIFIED_CONTAM: SDR family oxidoreductase [Anaerolineae bacterium]
MRVALLDVKADLLQSVQAELGANSTAFTVDLSDGEHTQAVAQQAVTWCGVPSVLVHNAAISGQPPAIGDPPRQTSNEN